MFRCCYCENTFENPHTYEENVGDFWGAPAYQTFSCCPYCKSDDIEEVEVEMMSYWNTSGFCQAVTDLWNPACGHNRPDFSED